MTWKEYLEGKGISIEDEMKENVSRENAEDEPNTEKINEDENTEKHGENDKEELAEAIGKSVARNMALSGEEKPASDEFYEYFKERMDNGTI